MALSQDDEISIIAMKQEHVLDVVRVHEVAFPGYFLTFLGRRFLRLLYSEILKTEGNSSVVAWSSKHQAVVGFAVAVSDQENFYSGLIQRRLFAFATAALRATIRNPRIIPRLLRALTYPSKSREAPAQACFLSMGVHPDMRGRQIAVRMTDKMMQGLKDNGAESVLFVIDRDVNERAKNFHYRYGARPVREYQTPEGRWMEDLVLDLKTWKPSIDDAEKPSNRNDAVTP